MRAEPVLLPSLVPDTITCSTISEPLRQWSVGGQSQVTVQMSASGVLDPLAAPDNVVIH